jgi:hypothetical protein
MVDREKVLSGLEHCRRGPIGCQQECPYTSDFGCRSQLAADALELLKDQEAVKPIKPICQGDDSYLCDNCGEIVGWEEMACCGIDQVKFKYCPGCGRAVKWDEAD